MSRPVERPGGTAPPELVALAGREVALRPLAEAVAERYFARFPGDLERYGEVARDWELHDTAHLLNWAIGDAEGWVDLERQVSWLAGVLAARGFPLEHLAANLELAADVVEERLASGERPAGAVASRLRAAAASVWARPPTA